MDEYLLNTKYSKYAKTIELKNNEMVENDANDNCIRLYIAQSPDHYNLQIRTFGPTNQFNRGKSRNMIATFPIDAADLLAMADFVRGQQKQYQLDVK